MIDAVVTHHLDGFRSGVARFNELLAGALGVPVRGLLDPAPAPRHPLLSFKVGELGPPEERRLAELLADDAWAPELFLHDFDALPLELRLVAAARRIHAGNDAIHAAVAPLHPDVTHAWAPSLIRDHRPLVDTELRVFSFGMAHKLRIDYFEQLRVLLEATGRSYRVHVSAANHETASLRDAELVFDHMHALFPETLWFLGNLSDVAIADQLRSATYFASFFDGGVRANNTSVAAAMESGTVVVTNLDTHSPSALVHLVNVVDIERCDRLPVAEDELAAIGERGRQTAAARDWEALVATLTR
jgi:hypothetical protein